MCKSVNECGRKATIFFFLPFSLLPSLVVHPVPGFSSQQALSTSQRGLSPVFTPLVSRKHFYIKELDGTNRSPLKHFTSFFAHY
jgi:hypothetical protein